MKTILVTGGLGFIGTHMVEKLNEEECQIDIVQNTLCFVSGFDFVEIKKNKIISRIFMKYPSLTSGRNYA